MHTRPQLNRSRMHPRIWAPNRPKTGWNSKNLVGSSEKSARRPRETVSNGRSGALPGAELARPQPGEETREASERQRRRPVRCEMWREHVPFPATPPPLFRNLLRLFSPLLCKSPLSLCFRFSLSLLGFGLVGSWEYFSVGFISPSNCPLTYQTAE